MDSDVICNYIDCNSLLNKKAMFADI